MVVEGATKNLSVEGQRNCRYMRDFRNIQEKVGLTGLRKAHRMASEHKNPDGGEMETLIEGRQETQSGAIIHFKLLDTMLAQSELGLQHNNRPEPIEESTESKTGKDDSG